MTAQDPFLGDSQANYPPRRGVTIVPTDGVLLANFPRKLWVGVTGALKVTMAGDGPSGTPVTLLAIPAGTMLDLQVCIVWSTGSTNQTSTSVIGFFD